MKTLKKLLNSALVLGIVLGNSGSTVVEATTALSKASSTVSQSTTTKKAKQKEKETKASKASKKNITVESLEKEFSETKVAESKGSEKVGSSTRSEDEKKKYDAEVAKSAVSYIEETFRKQDLSLDTFSIGDQIRLINFMIIPFDQTKQPYVPIIPPRYIMEYRPRLNTNKQDMTYISKSGNWKLEFLYNYVTNPNKEGYNGLLTRLKYGVEKEEIFELAGFSVDFRTGYEVSSVVPRSVALKDYTFSVKFPTAEETIGSIQASVKTGDHVLQEGEQTIPAPSTYIDSVDNHRGRLQYRWSTPPDTSIVGRQNTKIIISDETERELEVTVPITVTPAPIEITPKAGAHQIAQYAALPNAADYFDVKNSSGTHRVEWLDDVSTHQAGIQTWRAKAIASDGREATSSIQMEVIPNSGLQVKLKPMTDRLLGNTYTPLATNFRDYIEEVQMMGEPVDLDKLEFVAVGSTEPNTQFVGSQPFKLTVQMRHPESGVMIRGTAETTVNVRWGDTLFLRSANGKSAGAFSLQVGNTNGAPGTITMTPGVDSPLDEAVGSADSPFPLYYSFRILRNDREIYNQKVVNRQTLRSAMNNFGDAKNSFTVQMGDIVEIYQPERTEKSSVVMIDEQEKDFTYGSPYAYYRVTPHGFDPAPLLKATAASQKFGLAEDTSSIAPEQLVKEVTLNNQPLNKELYQIEQLDDFDTTTIGKRNVRLSVRLKDGLAATEIEVPYEVAWGSTIILKGLEDATVGTFTAVKENNQWLLRSIAGIDTTDPNAPVNNVFGRGVYYWIEVEEPSDNETVVDSIDTPFIDFPLLTENERFRYEVTGDMTIGQAISGFNHGQPLAVSEGAIVRVYHAEPESGNLLMLDGIIKDFTGGTNLAQYQVTSRGLEPIVTLQADAASQKLVLGQDGTEIAAEDLIKNVHFNGEFLNKDLYEVEKIEEFDTSSVGNKTLKAKVTDLKSGVSADIEVPYTVSWGKTLQIKNKTGDTVGAFSLINQDNRLMLYSTQGASDTDLAKRVSKVDDRDVYYSVEVLKDGQSRFNYEVKGNLTIEQAVERFNHGQPLEIYAGDTVRVYHSELGKKNLLMSEEKEKDFTYGSRYAYYDVDPYDFEPTSVLDFDSANVNVEQGTSVLEPNTLVKNVTVNGVLVPEDAYTVTLDTPLDTTKLGEKTANVTVKTSPSFGSTTDSKEVTYEVVEQGTLGTTGEQTVTSNTTDSNANDSNANDPNYGDSSAANSENLPKTNTTKSTVLTFTGLLVLAAVGGILFWKKRKAVKK